MNRLGVVGCGVMGAGIAEIGAKGGCDVVVVDAFPEALENAQKRMAASLAKAEEKGKLAEPADAILARIRWTTDIAALADREIVTEAIRETVEDKVALIAQLDAVLAADAIIATNTSSIPVAQIAAASTHPERVLGTHYFNPVPVMPLVEVVSVPPDRSRRRRRHARVLRRRAGQEGHPGEGPLGLRRQRPSRARTSSTRSARSRTASPRRRTSTRAWSAAAACRWARCACAT